jgi:hypothetical protein
MQELWTDSKMYLEHESIRDRLSAFSEERFVSENEIVYEE